ncbi:uncharacterized protein LOC143150324 [Ptiloglossa arizonensis]|uniref:uncharacterized protein LOC143150324 n=1 Tax=Ptiloglossa arizonensis TaxID=3350558 RepID=UPI003FA113EA
MFHIFQIVQIFPRSLNPGQKRVPVALRPVIKIGSIFYETTSLSSLFQSPMLQLRPTSALTLYRSTRNHFGGILTCCWSKPMVVWTNIFAKRIRSINNKYERDKILYRLLRYLEAIVRKPPLRDDRLDCVYLWKGFDFFVKKDPTLSFQYGLIDVVNGKISIVFFANFLYQLHSNRVTVFEKKKKRKITKINIIVSSIPLSVTRNLDLTLLLLGVSLNLLIILTIVCKSSMRRSINLYLVSLACSNMVILLDPLEVIIRWFFNVDTKINMDYVCMISFDVSVITIAILKFQLYLIIFKQDTRFGLNALSNIVTVKGILLVWSSCTIALAIALHIYDYFEGDMAEIYILNTIMFTGLPVLVYLALDCFVLYELKLLKAMEGSWRLEELRYYIMLVVVTIAFLLIRTPYRLARAINFMAPNASCCVESTREILYFIAKMYPTVFAIIYVTLSTEFQRAIQVRLQTHCRLNIHFTCSLIAGDFLYRHETILAVELKWLLKYNSLQSYEYRENVKYHFLHAVY